MLALFNFSHQVKERGFWWVGWKSEDFIHNTSESTKASEEKWRNVLFFASTARTPPPVTFATRRVVTYAPLVCLMLHHLSPSYCPFSDQFNETYTHTTTEKARATSLSSSSSSGEQTYWKLFFVVEENTGKILSSNGTCEMRTDEYPVFRQKAAAAFLLLTFGFCLLHSSAYVHIFILNLSTFSFFFCWNHQLLIKFCSYFGTVYARFLYIFCTYLGGSVDSSYFLV